MAHNNQRFTADDLDGSLRIQNRFLVLRKLGQGTYGKVQLALKKETNEEVAVKTIKKCKIENDEDMLRIRREIHIMTSLRHPHIIHINEVFETKQKIVIVMQYASGGELYEYLGCHQKLPEDEARRIFRQIASAIYYCHKNQICHRDLKLENILLDEEGNAQIGDFGLSNIFDDKRRMNTFCGSPLYASPEIVKGTPYKGPEVDCWSLGVLLYTLVYGTMPFDGRSFKELVSQISEGRYEEPTNKSSASFLIRWLLTPDISRRATITDVCKDNWINQGYDSNLLEIAEKMALTAGYSREQMNATKLRLENVRDTSISRKTAAQLEDKAATFSSLYTKNFGNIHKTNVTSQACKSSIHEQIRNYDVRFALNKLIAAVETSLNAEKNLKHSTVIQSNRAMEQNREELMPRKVDSASVIPIFEVTSTIPCNTKEKSQETSKRMETISKIFPNNALKTLNECHDQRKNILNNKWKKMKDMPEENSLEESQGKNNHQETNSIKKLLTDSQMQYHLLNISGKSEMHEADIQTPKVPRDRSVSEPIGLKRKDINDCLPSAQKHPFIRTKHHVLTLSRLLSLNYEKLMKNSFRMPTCRKKPPGKIKIPPTFDPNNSPSQTNKQQDEKKGLLIFPTVSVSENKEKIQKKIEKIKKAALDKNIIIRSDSKTRMRIENYIRSQVKKIQDLVREEQSHHTSLEHLDEQSLRDMSEMYYCAFGSGHTDSGIANTEDDENFCFLCSKPQDIKGTSKFFDSIDLENIKKKCFYTSNHLHIPRRKGQYASNHGDIEFGSLTRCKSEIKLPIEYLNYISPNKLDLNKRLQNKQQILTNNSIKYFLTAPSFGSKAGNSNLRILRSASDSAGLNLSKNAFEVLKLDSQNHDSALQMYTSISHFLEQTSAGCSYSEMTNFETQSTAADDDTFQNRSQNRLEKDDGIGNSNDSFQSYIDTLENDHNDLSRSMGSFHLNSLKAKSNYNNPFSMKAFSNYSSGNDYVNEFDDFERQQEITAEILNWKIAFDKEKGFVPDNRRKLERRNTTACTFDKSEDIKCDQTKSEFQNYLWNAYKEHLLENNQNDTEYSSSPNLNYYSLDRKTKFKNRNCKSMDYLHGDKGNDIRPNTFLDFPTSVEQDASRFSSTVLENTVKHSNNKKRLPERSADSLSKLLWSDTLSHTDMDDSVLKLKGERKLFLGNRTQNANNSNELSFSPNLLNNLEKIDKKINRNCYSKNKLPLHKRTNSEHKKSFLQLLALKSIQEAEKELQNTHRRDELNVEDETSGSLLEALKSQGYKSVISQRFQDTDNDSLDPFQMKYFKSPAQLRAELAQLNSMYYETLPMYAIDPREDNDYLYDDLDYSRWMLSGLATQSLYDMQADFEKQTPKQSVYDWLHVTPIDESIDAKSRVSLYIPEETTPNPEMKRCWARDNYADERPLESQHVLRESPSFPKKKILPIGLDENKNSKSSEKSHTLVAISDDENQESVQDRIWRKSFYSRFNNRALSRKERLSFREPELLSLSENRHGQLNNIRNSPSKTLYDKTELSQWNGSNKSFRTKRSKKHSQSFDQFDFESMKKKYCKPGKERENECRTKESFSNKSFSEVCNTDNEEPEH